jgi:hypothetical protein
VTLEVETLLERGRQAAGLADYGDRWFLPPLERLVDAINAEAGLVSDDEPPVQRIVQSLADRLHMVELLRLRPEILEEPVEVAGVIMGLPRTGSTMLQRLLGSSPQLTSGYWWEVTFPLPFADEQPGDPTPRHEAARAMVQSFYETWPDFQSIHPMDAMAHDEDVILLDKTFLSSTYDSILNVPSYGLWMAQQDHIPAYRELRMWLQVLQDQSPWRRGRKWILKSPHHLTGLGGFLAVFPEALAIMTHRDVAELVPSYCSMCASITAPHSNSFDPKDLGPYWSGRFSRAMRRLIDTRAGTQGNRFVDIAYADLLQDPITEAKRVFTAAGLVFRETDEAAMATWLAANNRQTRPAHRYAPETYGLTEDGLDRDFAFYRRAFSIEGVMPS